jgi:hypothetical protein
MMHTKTFTPGFEITSFDFTFFNHVYSSPTYYYFLGEKSKGSKTWGWDALKQIGVH